ncbi:MAG: hypothetical protein ABII90_13700 [Bacteroidota bacterium]
MRYYYSLALIVLLFSCVNNNELDKKDLDFEALKQDKIILDSAYSVLIHGSELDDYFKEKVLLIYDKYNFNYTAVQFDLLQASGKLEEVLQQQNI